MCVVSGFRRTSRSPAKAGHNYYAEVEKAQILPVTRPMDTSVEALSA